MKTKKPSTKDITIDLSKPFLGIGKDVKPKKARSKVVLTVSQKKALDMLNGKDNVFLTGVAGSGKSFLIDHFRQDNQYPVLASTGAAAILVGGRTFHSFFGLGIMEGGAEATYQRIKEKNDGFLRTRLKSAAGIIIDEISMIPGVALNVAERLSRLARRSQEPWGGLRVIAVGDFAQLPPVNKETSSKDWAFKSKAWSVSNFVPIVLREVVRTGDQNLLKTLNHVRTGVVVKNVVDFLESRKQNVSDDFNGTRLFPHRHTVDSFNFQKVKALPGGLLTFKTKYQGLGFAIDALKKQAPIPEELHIKIGALVMVRINDPEGMFANGSLGHVEEVNDEEDEVLVTLLNGFGVRFREHGFKFYDGKGTPVGVATNFPFTLAYATTIHKSQGATIDRVSMDISGLWEPGQAYVALSRAKTAEGIFIENWDKSSIIADPEVIEFHESLLNQTYTTENRGQ